MINTKLNKYYNESISNFQNVANYLYRVIKTGGFAQNETPIFGVKTL